ncbi:hypothetical protein [Kordiimonas sp.]|uniref:hypothetical protein n=1 Tax=Kordiimonas sp. TaxID=1970157 RepID=UPI003A94EBB0
MKIHFWLGAFLTFVSVTGGAAKADETFENWALAHIEGNMSEAFAELIAHKSDLWNGLALLGACGEKAEAGNLIRDLLPYKVDFSRKIAARASGLDADKEQQLRAMAEKEYGRLVTGYAVSTRQLLFSIMRDAPETRDAFCLMADRYYERYLQNRETLKMQLFWKKRSENGRNLVSPPVK